MPSKDLPTANAIGKLIASLVGKSVTAKPGQALKELPKGGVAVVYVDEAQTVVAIIVTDVAMAAAAGASLAMIPVGAAQDATRSGVLPPNMAENFREVTNVMASLLTTGSGRVVRQAEFSVGAVPAQAGGVMSNPSGRLDLEVDVQGYGKGALSILVA